MGYTLPRPMLETGYNVPHVDRTDILFLVTSVGRVQELSLDFVIADRHALLAHAQFSADTAQLSTLSWDLWNARDFKYDPEEPGKKERYQAEFLVHRYLPTSAIREIACYNRDVEERIGSMLQGRGETTRVEIHEDWYF